MTLNPTATPAQDNTGSGEAAPVTTPEPAAAPAAAAPAPADGAAPAAAPADAPAPHWSDGIPALKDNPEAKAYGSPEEMVAAHKAMAERIAKMGDPVTDVKELKLEIPEGIDPNNPMFDWFQKKVVERGLGKGYAQEVLNDFVTYQAEVAKQMNKHCLDVLQAQWGPNVQKELQTCNDTIGTFDRALPGFGKWVTSNPSVGSAPEFVNFIHYLSKAIGEDTLPAGKGGASPSREMSPENFLKEVFVKEGSPSAD